MAAIAAASVVAAGAAYAANGQQRGISEKETARAETRLQTGAMNIRSSAKCPGCGSHEYRATLGGRVCSYCRIPK